MKDNLKRLIVDVLKQQEAIAKLNKDNRTKIGDEIALLEFLSSLKSDFLYSSELASFIADALQMLDSEDQIEQFQLKDILNIYKTIWLNNKSNIEYFKDYILFKINVMNQTSGVNLEITNYIKTIEKEKAELYDILSSLT